MVTTYETIRIESKLFKTISKLAKKENTTENNIVNDIVKKRLENSKNRRGY